MNRLIAFALKQRFFVIGGVLSLVGAGLFAVMRVPFDAFPDLTGTRVEVITVAPGMAPEDVERLVTFPIESSLMGIPGASEVRSVSKFGLSLITVPFPDDFDIYFARTLVQQRLGDAQDLLPDGVEPSLGPVSTPMGELYQYVLTSDSLTLTELTTLHNTVVRPRLRTVPGVSEVNSWGGFTEQVHIVVDPIRLAARRLTLADVDRALAENNLTFGGSYLESGGERFTVRGLGRIDRREELGRIVIGAHGGTATRVRDVATIEPGALQRSGAVTKDGNGEVVAGMVLKLQGCRLAPGDRGVAHRAWSEVRAGAPGPCRTSRRSTTRPTSWRRTTSHDPQEPGGGRSAGHCRALPVPAQRARIADRGVGHPAVDARRLPGDERLRVLGEPDEPGRTRLRAHRRRVGGDGRELRATPRGRPARTGTSDSPVALSRAASRSRPADPVRHRDHCRGLHPHLHARRDGRPHVQADGLHRGRRGAGLAAPRAHVRAGDVSAWLLGMRARAQSRPGVRAR
jgi:hypothetical protein